MGSTRTSWLSGKGKETKKMANKKIEGLKEIAGASKRLRGYYSGLYLQVNYNCATGDAWYNEHFSLGQNSWTQYDDKDIINCGNISAPTTMKRIKELILEAVRHAT